MSLECCLTVNLLTICQPSQMLNSITNTPERIKVLLHQPQAPATGWERSIKVDSLADGSFYSNRVSEIMQRGLTNKMEHTAELTDREIELLKLACTELPYKPFASLLQATPKVAEATRDNLFKKLDVVSRVGLEMYALKKVFISWNNLLIGTISN